eukprot:352952-Chlamydomonas_euryale.AAC.9
MRRMPCLVLGFECCVRKSACCLTRLIRRSHATHRSFALARCCCVGLCDGGTVALALGFLRRAIAKLLPAGACNKAWPYSGMAVWRCGGMAVRHGSVPVWWHGSMAVWRASVQGTEPGTNAWSSAGTECTKLPHAIRRQIYSI